MNDHTRRTPLQIFSRLPREERVALVVAIVFAALATIGQGLQFFSDDFSVYSTGMLVVVIFSTLAGIALAFEADVFPSNLDAAENHVRALALKSSLEQTLIVCAIELVVGEILFLIALAAHAPGINGDISVILAPLLVGALFGGMFCLIGLLVGMLIAWPLVKLAQYLIGRRARKPMNPVTLAMAVLFPTLVAFAVFGVLGSHPPDVYGTPRGRGLYDIVYLYTNYSGTPSDQLLAWIARALGLVIALEVVWVRRVGHVHGIGENMTIDPPAPLS